MGKRTRRQFSEEYKREAVLLITRDGQRLTEAARALGLDATVLSRWVREYKEHGGEEGLNPSEREELKALRKQVKRLEEERDILKKATIFFAQGRLRGID